MLKLDVRLQWRYGFYYAAAFSIIVWEVLVLLVPDQLRHTAMPYIVFGDSVIIGYFFIAGAVFFEKGERTLFALLTTPVRFGHYLAGKLGTLGLLSLVAAFLVVGAGVGLDFGVLALMVAVVLCTQLFLLAAFITAAPFPSITDWLIPSTAVIAALSVPLLYYSGLWEHPVLYAIPTQGSLLLLGSAFDQVSLPAWQVGYSVGYQLLWIAGLILLARRVFDRYVIAREGSE
ncbi:MAG: fluoroquinolone transporter permease [Pseudonocardiaceae bacterium]